MVIQNITWSPRRPVVGDTVQFNAYFGNQGPVPITVWSYNCYYVDGALVSEIGVGPQNPGSMGNINTFSWVASSPGEHVVKAVADCTNVINKSINALVRHFGVLSEIASINYVVHIDFHSFLPLDSVSVSVYDQRNRLEAVAATSEPNTYHIDIYFSTAEPKRSLTAQAAGQADFFSIMIPVSGSSTITTSNGYEYWMQVNLY